MQIIPAIDLKDGKCVRLRQGLAGTESVYSDDPMGTALRWQEEGASMLHVVDLDGAFSGNPQNRVRVAEIIRSLSIRVQVAGGIRSLEDIEYFINCGSDGVVLGTKVVSDPKFLEEACRRFSGRISVGLDARNGMVVVKGWTASTSLSALELADRIRPLSVRSIIFTDVSRDGMLEGPNLEAIREMASHSAAPLVASGGVSSLEDLRSLLPLESDGVSGVIIGKALYTGAVRLSEALSLAGK